jgi:2-methylcitrate dehydratase PrpD
MLQSSADTIARKLSRFVVDLRWEDLPANVIQRAKQLVLDQIGCELVGSTMTWVEPAVKLAELSAGASLESTVVNRGMRLPAAEAAFVNATFGHACELDDTAYGSAGHIGSAVVPVALAVGEARKADGRAFLAAVVAGYEVMYRMLAAVAPHNSERGFHSQSIAGPFGGAAAAGKLMGFDEERMTNALAIAGSHSSGTMEYDQSGGEVKRVHAGIAARGGVHAALLAGFGLTGPSTIVEGKRGFAYVFSDKRDLTRLTDGLGERLEIMNCGFKMYPAVGMSHTSISAAARLAATHDIAPGRIRRIAIRMAPTGVAHCGSIDRPRDAIGAQFSVKFSVALALCKGRNQLSDYLDPANWSDPEILGVIDKIDVGEHPEAQGPMLRLAEVDIEMDDGAIYRAREEQMRGSVVNPASTGEVRAKMIDLATAALPRAQVDDIIGTVEEIETVADIGALTKMLSGEMSRGGAR